MNNFEIRKPSIIVQHSQWNWGHDYHLMTSDGHGFVRLYMEYPHGNNFSENIICDLYVDTTYRRRGYATALLDECDRIIREYDGIIKDTSITIIPKEDWMRDWYTRRGYTIREEGTMTWEEMQDINDVFTTHLGWRIDQPRYKNEQDMWEHYAKWFKDNGYQLILNRV